MWGPDFIRMYLTCIGFEVDYLCHVASDMGDTNTSEVEKLWVSFFFAVCLMLL